MSDQSIRLGALAQARSGDKGNRAQHRSRRQRYCQLQFAEVSSDGDCRGVLLRKARTSKCGSL